MLNIEKIIAHNSIENAYLYVASVYNFKQHPYFVWMHNQATCKEFLSSQLSFRYAVESFSCALGACLSKLHCLAERVHIVENIMEEHGNGNLANAHKNTFITYLTALGATTEEIEKPSTVGVWAFNEAIRNFCVTHCGYAGAALLGMIEYLYIDISGQIAAKINSCKWAEPGSQSHYGTHEVLDVEHARELFDICEPFWQTRKHEVGLGMALGAHYFWDLYSSMQVSNS